MLKQSSLALLFLWLRFNHPKKSQLRCPPPSPKGARVALLHLVSPPAVPWHMSGYHLSTAYLLPVLEH